MKDMEVEMIRICILILAFILTGCSSKKPELTFMIGGTANEFSFWEKTIADFTEKTGISVELLRSATQTEQRKQQILIALRGKQPDPDIVVMDIAWIGQMARSGWLKDLFQYQIDTSAFFSNIITLADIYNSGLIGVPLYVDAGILYYRTDLLAKYGYDGPPDTWDALVSMAKDIQEKERVQNPDFWGFVWQGAQYEGLVCTALEFFVSAGGGFFDSKGNPRINSRANTAALGFMRDCIHTYGISPPNTYTDMKEEEVRLVFHNSNALFERNWPYAAKLHDTPEAPVNGKYAFGVLPHFKGHLSASALGGWHAGISAYSDRTEDAAEFIKFITSRKVQQELLTELGHNPGRKDIYSGAGAKTERLASLKDIFSSAVPRPTVPYYSQVSQVLQKYLNAGLANSMEPSRALSEAQKEIERIKQDYEN
ncbi:MAG: extracellular solute-binding protein [Chitinivibrionales bacterium]|nr:extracellular solute-binding protein [Chitinivibrionales bacterium]